MGLPQFEDVYQHHTASGFGVTNEEPDLHRQLLGRRMFRKAACIASAGEIPFFVLLPRCREVVAIDHSYRSLVAAYTKALLLEQLGPAGVRNLMVNSRDPNELVEAALKVKDLLPENLRKHATFTAITKDSYGYTGGGTFTEQDWRDLRREWREVRLSTLRAAVKNLHHTTFIHGDLKDLEKRGPFDLLYISNAMEHSGRNGIPKPKDFVPLLKEGGLLLSTRANSYKDIAEPAFRKVNDIRGYRSQWWHILHERITPQEKVA